MSPRLLRLYAETANELRAKRSEQEVDITAWLTGAYVGRAIDASFSRRARYPDKPFTMQEPEGKSSSSKKAAAEFAAWAAKFNSQAR